MAVYKIRGPDGKLYKISGPAGATPEQLMSLIGGGAQQDDWAERTRVDDGSLMQQAIIGAGRGFTDIHQGVQQWFRGDEYDQRIKAEEDLYQQGMGDSLAAMAGRIGGNIAGTAIPAGAAMRGVSAAPRIAAALEGGLGARTGAAALQGAAAGATEGALLADTSGQGGFADNLGRTLSGGVIGGAFGAGTEGVLSALSAARNTPRRLVEGLSTPRQNALAGRFLGRVDDAVEGDRLAASTGVDLSPAQRSSGRAATMAENLSRQSIFTMDTAFQGDFVRGEQMVNTVRNMAARLAPDGDSISAVQEIRQATERMARDLAQRRSRFGREAYGKVDQAAGGAAVVMPESTFKSIQSILDEFDGVVGSDANKIRAQAAGFMDAFGDPEFAGVPTPLTASKALRQLQAWSDAARGNGRLFDEITPNVDRMLAGRLRDALLEDLDRVAAEGGTVGDLIRTANAGWKARTESIRALEASPLGAILGEEMADELSGIAFNRMAPEAAFDKLRNAHAQHLQVAKDFLLEHNPEAWKKFQRAVLNEALAESQAAAPSLGANTLPINPAAFVKALEGSSGRASVKQSQRLQVIFGDTEEWGALQDLLEVGRRMADSTGRNFSGTAPANEALGALNKLSGGLGKAVGFAGNVLGLQHVARGMVPGASALPYYSAPRNMPLPWMPLPKAIRRIANQHPDYGPLPMAGLSGLMGAQALNYSGQDDRPR